MSIVVSFRITPEELAKALEGLTENNSNPNELTTISSIARTTFYYGIINLCKNPTEPVKQEYTQKIQQIMNQNKRNKSIDLKELLKG